MCPLQTMAIGQQKWLGRSEHDPTKIQVVQFFTAPQSNHQGQIQTGGIGGMCPLQTMASRSGWVGRNMTRPNFEFSFFTAPRRKTNSITINTLDCDQSNYSSCIDFSHIPIEFGQTGNSAIRFSDPENPTVEPNMKWIGRPLAEIWPFEIFPNLRSVIGCWSVLNIYFFLHCSHILHFATLRT